jgi:hypothetical protein
MLIELSNFFLSDLVDNYILTMGHAWLLVIDKISDKGFVGCFVLWARLNLSVAKRPGFLVLCIHFRSSSRYWRVFSLLSLKFLVHLSVIVGHL